MLSFQFAVLHFFCLFFLTMHTCFVWVGICFILFQCDEWNLSPQNQSIKVKQSSKTLLWRMGIIGTGSASNYWARKSSIGQADFMYPPVTRLYTCWYKDNHRMVGAETWLKRVHFGSGSEFRSRIHAFLVDPELLSELLTLLELLMKIFKCWQIYWMGGNLEVC